MLKNKHILIIVENLPVPFDRRVWQEALTLKENGAYVSVICPKMKGYNLAYEKIDGVEIYRHPMPHEANGALGYLIEYTNALFWELLLSLKIFIKKRFHIIHGCNPPDLIFIVALFYKVLGVKYVFDHHDVNPELYVAKFNRQGYFYKLLVFFERLTFATANYTIATNESYKNIAIQRGRKHESKVFVIRSGPNLDVLRLNSGNIMYKKGRKYLIGYVGVVGEQEGLDDLLNAIKIIVSIRQDAQFAIVGSGTELEKLKQMASHMQLEDYVDFYGRVDDKKMNEILSTTDVCVNPDKPTEMNDISTMNKIMEYMALKKPIVQYNLKEGRFSAEEASLYAVKSDTKDFADKIIWLLDHPEERESRGQYGYERVEKKLSWKHESQKLIKFYDMVFSKS